MKGGFFCKMSNEKRNLMIEAAHEMEVEELRVERRSKMTVGGRLLLGQMVEGKRIELHGRVGDGKVVDSFTPRLQSPGWKSTDQRPAGRQPAVKIRFQEQLSHLEVSASEIRNTTY